MAQLKSRLQHQSLHQESYGMLRSGDNDTIDLENSDMIYDNIPYAIEMEVKPIKGLMPGDYTLTIGARYGSVSYSKIIDLVVTK